jgi:hypothetical protein
MHRLIARLLLLATLVGNLGPLALAAAAAPPHACCLRKAVHRCHGSLAPETEFVIRDASCCNHDCCRAVTSARWAHAQPKLAAFFLQTINRLQAGSQPGSPVNASAEFQSSRAPPAC